MEIQWYLLAAAAAAIIGSLLPSPAKHICPQRIMQAVQAKQERAK